MQNKDNDTTKILLGAIVGGLIGGAALYLLHSGSGEKPLLNKIVGALSEIGDTIEESRADNADEAIDDIEKNIPHGENVISEALTLIATGINLWNKIKKGR
ncbi:MAG TPA: YtxH domain-containing protein [Chlamydiales bacterium]|nr:YtxH domain-containing protein [Chlamydiales bacterium]